MFVDDVLKPNTCTLLWKSFVPNGMIREKNHKLKACEKNQEKKLPGRVAKKQDTCIFVRNVRYCVQLCIEYVCLPFVFTNLFVHIISPKKESEMILII